MTEIKILNHFNNITNIITNIKIANIKSVLLNFRTWLKNSRTVALPQSLLPAIAAVCMASTVIGFNIFLAVIAVVGVIFAHLSSNLFDDYFDYKKEKSDYRDKLAHDGIRARVAKCLYLTSGQNTLEQLFVASIIFGLIALIAGFSIWLFRGNEIIFWALIGAFLGISYSGYPFRLSYHGLGEPTIGLMFGPLLMTGVFFASTGTISPAILFVSFPVGMLVANIVYSHSIMDFEPDKRVGKRTFAGLINNKRGMLVASFIFNFVPFATIILGVLFDYLNVVYLLVFLTFPMAINLFYLMVQYYKYPDKEFSPKFWMGPFEKWEEKVNYGIGWFMIRWMLARNLLSFFCLIIALISIISHFI
jgi:1,4-dihydroxy-2-naphthoate octaprenyltransferase